MALVFVFVGLFWNPMLIFIAFLVWMGASLESGMVQFKSALAGVPMQRVMLTECRTLAPSDPLSRAVDYTMAGFQQECPVVEPDGRLVGVLTRAVLIGALAQRGSAAVTSDVMQREFRTADPSEMADGVLARLQECKCSSLPVLHQGRLVGIVTAEDLGECLMIQAALRGGGPAQTVTA